MTCQVHITLKNESMICNSYFTWITFLPMSLFQVSLYLGKIIKTSPFHPDNMNSAISYLLSWSNRQHYKRYPETHENLRIKILIRVKTTLVSIRNKTALQIFKFLYYPHYICEMFPQSTFYIVKYIKKWNKREIYLRLHINKSSQLPLFHIISMCVTNKNKECR